MAGKPKSVVGKHFGRLLVVRDSGGRARNGGVMWECKCECGGLTVVRGDLLHSGHTQSCGCLQPQAAREANTTHGLSRVGGQTTKTFQVWNSMMSRCYGTGKHTKYYKDKGITVCERWHHYPNFLADMGEAPAGMSIDRNDGEGNYEPSNCKWATDWEQGQNRSNGKIHFSQFPEVLEKRQYMTLKQLAEHFGVCESTMKDVLYQRIKRYQLQLIAQGK